MLFQMYFPFWIVIKTAEIGETNYFLVRISIFEHTFLNTFVKQIILFTNENKSYYYFTKYCDTRTNLIEAFFT